ncbi:MAG: prepilin peptidase [Gammaproteobacteria bacterium]|nr:MAG: prepilin peptidase [Gammaproteobacteria bacterium]|tara:strand:+ start:36 stop:800 length:765 start_codon:yes stop_codon:yes gene_type:complete
MTLVLFIIFAAILGSFLASFIYRFTNKNILKESYVSKINIFTEPSFCSHCKTKIDWYHLIPVLSYLFLRGKAKCCGATISSRYFLTEILVISSFSLIFITNDSWALILLKSFISLTLIFIALIDYQYKIIPLNSLLILFILALILSATEGLLILPEVFVTIISGFLLLATRWLFFKLKGKEGLGLGDVILFPILTLMIPMTLVPILLLTASLLGIVEFFLSSKLKRDSEIAFGFHLAIASYLGLVNFYPILPLI